MIYFIFITELLHKLEIFNLIWSDFMNKNQQESNSREFFFEFDKEFDKQIYLAMYEAENLKIVVTDNLTESEANLLADEFIELYNNGFDLTLKNLISSNFIDSSDEAIKLKKDNKMVIEKRF